MKVVLDTNVFVSGIFFSGPPAQILKAWKDSRVQIVVSAEIIEEYRRVGERLAVAHPSISIAPFLVLVALHGEVVLAPELPVQLCEDPTDDKFFACALAAGCSLIVSGDKHLHQASGFKGVVVHRPRAFVDEIMNA